MRASITVTLYVSLATGSFAQNTPPPNENTPAWIDAHEAGLAANRHRNYEEARVLLEQSWALARSTDERAVSAHDIGQILRRLGHPRAARQWLERAYDFWRADPASHAGLVIAATNLADLLRTTGDYTAAELLLRQTLAPLADDPVSAASIQTRLAELLREEGANEESRSLYENAVQVQGIAPNLRLSILVGLADIDRQAGDWDSSARRWNEVLDTARKQQDSLAESTGLRGLATVWLDMGNPARAAPLFRRALQMLENDPASPPGELAIALSGMGDFYRSQNKLALAEDAFSRALQIERKESGEEHPQVACLMENLAGVYSSRGEFSLARQYARRASDILAGSFGGDSLPAATALTNLAFVEQRANDLGAAAKYYERAVNIARAHLENRTVAAAVIHRYAEFLKTMHRGREAKVLDTEVRAFSLK
jgi:tetratricopeptide (TPR) repeat protein